MDTIEIIWLALMLVMLLLSAFFSGSEAAFLSIQRGKLAVMIKNKVRGAESVARLAGRPEKLLPTVLTGNNLTNTAAAALGTSLIATRLGPSESVIVSTVIITVLLLIFSETIPKTVAARNSERFASHSGAAPAVGGKSALPRRLGLGATGPARGQGVRCIRGQHVRR